jgi:hypothetical protein
MARRHHRRHYRHNPYNPGELGYIAGIDVSDTLIKAAGLSLTQFVDQQFAFPLVSGVTKMSTSTMAGKLVDVGTTIISAVVAREAVGLVSREYADDVFAGGAILAGGKALGAVSGGAISLTATYPPMLGRFGLPGAGGGGAPVALTSAAAGAVSGVAGVGASGPMGGGVPMAPMAALPPGGQANYPRPATVDSDVGI